jgi:hypothetical protein
MLGHGDPIRVNPGERMLLHVLNGSATEGGLVDSPNENNRRTQAFRAIVSSPPDPARTPWS